MPDANTPSSPRHAAPPTRRRVAVVYNPVKVERETLESLIEAEAAAAEWDEPLWLATSEDDPGEGVTRRAVDAGVDVVIVAGGDGTVRAAAQELRGSGIPLALLPSGTGNLLARNLDLTLDDAGYSIHSAFTGDDRAIDLGLIDIERPDRTKDRHAFLVMAGLGIDAKMIANTNPELKKRVGWLAYVEAIIKSFRDKDELRFRYRLDSGPVKTVSAHTLIVGNCGSLPANILLLPDAAVDDGMFDIVFLRPEGFLGWVQIWAKVAWENWITHRTRLGQRLKGEIAEVRALEYTTAASLTARFWRPEEVELDGDGFGKTIAIKTWIDPGALLVRFPALPNRSRRDTVA